ncbi:DUF429 domain-containing protein [Nocardiopsis alborubida]|uniref:DUF429 domain-containing protein n=1 Tax=Nocardiopsis alborubida TaxID=146802 RepID=A0A7X6MIT2_9ACTN|nr:DUF429 domain-containing protein [Nocardiopsis alborubida]NKZ01330.1 DUF429 domain-containing protein [Nocardiopsis alborubida]
MEVVGVDGCRKGWVTVHLVDGMFHRVRVCPSLEEAVDVAAAEAVTVDVPLGLVGSGWRECDLRVRGMLGPLASTVFRIPPRSVVETVGWEAASALCEEVVGQRLPRQTYSLFPKVLEADALRRAGAHRLYEVHPELSFRTMAGRPLAFSKKTWNGQRLRDRLLAEAGIRLPEDLGPGGKVAVDDVLDAAVAAWTAYRIATGQAVSCPDPPERDEQGEPIAIWY